MSLSDTDFCALLEEQRRTATGLRKRARTRALLECTGAQMLQDVGYRRFTVEGICERANISIGTLYIHFENKDALARRVLELFAGHYEEFMTTSAERGATPHHHAYNKFLAIIDLHRDCAGLIRSMIEMAEVDTDIARRWELAQSRVRQHLGRMCAAPSPIGLPPRMRNFLAHSLMALINSLLIPLYVDEDEELARALGKPSEVAELLTVVWARLIYFENPGSSLLSISRPLVDLKLDWGAMGFKEMGDLAPPLRSGRRARPAE